MKLNRRDFIMGSLALGGAAAVGGLAGCSAPKQTPSDQGAMPDTGAEKGIPENFTDGKWIGTAMGHDDELIAVIAAAVAAAMEQSGEENTTGFVVRSIRRINNAPAWNRAGREEQVYSRM